MPPKPGEIWWRRRDGRPENGTVHYVSDFSDKTSVCGMTLVGEFMDTEQVTCAGCILTGTSENTTGPGRRNKDKENT